MNTQNISGFFTKTDKSLLGVCCNISLKYNLPPILVRFALILLTFLFIPIGIIVYLTLFLIFIKQMKRAVKYAIIGCLLGMPLSYFFQSEMVQNLAGGITGYMMNFLSIANEMDRYMGNGLSIVWNGILGIMLSGIAGGIGGYYLEKNKLDKKNI
tara:strand:+ start:694 stop:1158 length:465 start_codon:yes stop_codon:yes gene_type:complete